MGEGLVVVLGGVGYVYHARKSKVVLVKFIFEDKVKDIK